jgi:hypothetical protein
MCSCCTNLHQITVWFFWGAKGFGSAVPTGGFRKFFMAVDGIKWDWVGMGVRRSWPVARDSTARSLKWFEREI